MRLVKECTAVKWTWITSEKLILEKNDHKMFKFIFSSLSLFADVSIQANLIFVWHHWDLLRNSKWGAWEFFLDKSFSSEERNWEPGDQCNVSICSPLLSGKTNEIRRTNLYSLSYEKCVETSKTVKLNRYCMTRSMSSINSVQVWFTGLQM